MPETYYYATGTEVTSIANAIRTKGGTNQQLEFPDDFVEAIEDLNPVPNLQALTVQSTDRNATYKHLIGYELVNAIYINDLTHNEQKSINLSGFSDGDTCYVKGSLCSINGGAVANTVDIAGTFTWASSNTYTKGGYTLTITSSSIKINSSYNGEIYGTNTSEIGYRMIGFYKKTDYNGFGPITVDSISNEFADMSTTDATAADIISGKKAGIISNGYGNVATGTLVIQHYYTGSSTPSSSLGVNGDIYLKT